MTINKGNKRKEFERASLEELSLLRDALLGPSQSELGLLSKLRNTKLAEVAFTDDATGQLRYHLKWTERGSLRTHTANAVIVAGESGRNDLLLDDVPSSIQPLGLLVGDFDSKLFDVHSTALYLRAIDPVQTLPQMDGGLQNYSVALGAASGEEFTTAIHATDSPVPENQWDIRWPENEPLTIEFRSSVKSRVDELPAVVTVSYFDDDGHHHQHSVVTSLELIDTGEPASWRKQIDSQQIPYPGNNLLVNCNIRPAGLDDMVNLDAYSSSTPNRILLAQYLASRKFNSHAARLDNVKGRLQGTFINIEGDLPSKAAIEFAERSTEAGVVDVNPFDQVLLCVTSTSPMLLKYAKEQTGDWNVADELVQEAILPVVRNRQEYIDIFNSTAVDANGALGGEEGIRRKLFSNLSFKLLDYFSDPKNKVGNLKFIEHITSDQSLSHNRNSPQRSLMLATENSLELELVDYLTELERIVHSLPDLSVNAVVETLKTCHAMKATKHQVRTARDKIAVKQEILVALHRLFRQPVSDAPLLSQVEFDFAVRTKLIGENPSTVIKTLVDAVRKKLKADGPSDSLQHLLQRLEDSPDAFEHRVNEAIEVACAAIGVFKRQVKASQSRGDDEANQCTQACNSEANQCTQCYNASFEVQHVYVALEWLVRPSAIEILSTVFKMEPIQVQGFLQRLGPAVHAQILIDRGLLKKRAKELLEYWMIDGNDFDTAASLLKDSVDENKSDQEKKLERDKRKWKPGQRDLPRKTRELDLESELKEILGVWQTETAVPSEYRQLPLVEK